MTKTTDTIHTGNDRRVRKSPGIWWADIHRFESAISTATHRVSYLVGLVAVWVLRNRPA